MKTLRSIGLFACILAFASGCASVAKIEKDEAADFSNYKTFAWAEDARDHFSDIQETNLRNAVTNELTKAEWREESKRPDIILKPELLVENSVRESNSPVYSQPYARPVFNPYTRRWMNIYYPSQLIGYDSRQYEVKEGTLTLSMIDTKTDKVIWQGWTTEQMENGKMTSKDLTRSAKNILKNFDPSK